jgi:hypothetical protein
MKHAHLFWNQVLKRLSRCDAHLAGPDLEKEYLEVVSTYSGLKNFNWYLEMVSTFQEPDFDTVIWTKLLSRSDAHFPGPDYEKSTYLDAHLFWMDCLTMNWKWCPHVLDCLTGFWKQCPPVLDCLTGFWRWCPPVLDCLTGFWKWCPPVLDCLTGFWKWCPPVLDCFTDI